MPKTAANCGKSYFASGKLELMKIFITGLPGSGKSTVLIKTIELLGEKEIKVGGFITPEMEERGRRTGFYVKDIVSTQIAVFASIHFRFGPRLGKYGVDVDAFDRIAIKAIDFALAECDVIVIDEIGKLEFYSGEFQKKLTSILLVDKPVLAAVHRAYIQQLKNSGEILTVTKENRNELPKQILQKLNLN